MKFFRSVNQNVSATDWGNFLCRIFDIWVKNDVGTYFVNYFDNTLAAYAGQHPSLCSMAPYKTYGSPHRDRKQIPRLRFLRICFSDNRRRML